MYHWRWPAFSLLSAMLLLAVSFPVYAYTAALKMRPVEYLGHKLDAAIWYPSQAEEKRVEYGPYALHIARDGQPVAGKYALILFSHGSGGNLFSHADLAEQLARDGFVVAALTHAGDNYRDRSLIADAGRYLTERPAQISALLDTVLADHEFAQLVDPLAIGAMGHSAGGYTVAALMGAHPDPERMAAHCRDHAGTDGMCIFADPRFGVSPAIAVEPFPMPLGVPLREVIADARIRAGALLAPLAVPLTPGSLRTLNRPVLLIGASEDQVLNPKYHFSYLASELPLAKVVIESGAGHYSFISVPAESKGYMLGVAAQDPDGFDRAAFHVRLAHDLSTFFKSALVSE
ncbi:alpha/beta hydrolase family protein [Ralstonia chuxiongensis]|uniref:alpha/beta hydrolase family protein n=1 Tax=Ralstonia chuxiongensis TaxID=2957504 RepID=UPI0028F53FF3|nr:hypothetical protein [Ralstonia chuxiongensis]CAJ0783498.1 hypothetical protein R8510_05139 [Ralstonia chuxiongensis]